MTCTPPPPEPPSAYGDLVPLGFLLRSLERAREREAADAFEGFAVRLLADGLRRRLEERRDDGLWAFHSGRLVTATDSALVLLGVRDPAAVEALERFADGRGGYYPQLWSAEGGQGAMLADPCNRHWRQADYATTCLVSGLRREAGLPRRTPVAWLASGFERRSGLYFANPLLVDWCLALGLGDEPVAAPLRARLRDEILAGQLPDGGFGSFDEPLSTALAVLALSELGYRGRRVLTAQLRLLEQLERSRALPPVRPFYSTFLGEAREGDPASGRLRIADTVHELSLYEDSHQVIFMSLASLALAVEAEPDDGAAHHPAAAVHARYRCGREEYLSRFALPPYVESLTAAADGVSRR